MLKDNVIIEKNFHKLNNKWCLWAHLPHDTDWTMASYKIIYTFDSVEEAIALTETIPEKMVQNCMMFLMRDGIKPLWEDPENKNGGSFSYKVMNKGVAEIWKNMFYSIIGETITDNKKIHLNGLTISPKKNFCIIKIWTKTRDVQDPSIFNINDINSIPCLFKPHCVN